MDRIPVAGPWITQKEIDYVNDAVTHAWYANAGKYHARFEQAFADYLGVKHAISLPSCTSGLHLALAACDIGPGAEVILPDCTWIATSAPITYVECQPVFADIDPQTWCLSAESFEACITPRTKAVIPVDLYGGMPDMDAIRAVADRHGIRVIEDAAEAIGSIYKGRRAGSLGDAGVFSFHGSKTLTTGEGGMLVTDDTALCQRALFLRDHGRPPGDRMFRNTEVAFKYKMSSMQAALGLAQLERVEELITRKRDIFAWYREGLADVPELSLNFEAPETLNSYWMVTIVWDSSVTLTKEQWMAGLDARGIDSRPFFHPLSSLEAYAGMEEARVARERNRVSYDLSRRAMNLPSALCLTREQVARVCQAVKEILGR